MAGLAGAGDGRRGDCAGGGEGCRLWRGRGLLCAEVARAALPAAGVVGAGQGEATPLLLLSLGFGPEA